MRASILALLPILWAAPAVAQHMDHSAHQMTAPATAPVPSPVKTPDPVMDHADHDMSAMPGAAPMQDSPPPVAEGQAQPPPVPTDNQADRFYDPAAMERVRAALRDEHGGARVSKVMADLFEYQARSGGDGYRWTGEAWWGDDLNRFVVKSEGEGGTREGVEAAEVQALYSRAAGLYTDLQVGLRQDVEPKSRTYATVGFETLLPYWVDAGGALFLSDKGDALARLEGSYDLRLTQRLILQPRAELNFAFQDIAATQTGSGLSTTELGLRLRYDVRREWGPYVGVSHERDHGKTADFARAAGHRVETTSFVMGLRAWF